MAHGHDTSHSQPPHGGHEKTDVVFAPIVRASIVMLIILLAVFGIARVTLQQMARYEAESSPKVNPLAGSLGRRLPPEPRLQTHPVQDLRDLQASQRERLSTYGWIDESKGIVHLPIERAMELVLQRGLPHRDAAEVQP